MRHRLARLAATLVLPLVASAASAQVVYSGPLNLAVPNTLTGLFVNVLTGTTYSGPSAFPTCPGAGCNYDFNIFGTTTWSLFAPGSSGQSPAPVDPSQRGFVAASATGDALALSEGTLIGGASVFNPGQAVSGVNLVGGTNRIFGFRFRNEAASTVHYGWARVRLTNGAPGTLVDYGFNATAGASIAAGDMGMTTVIPEPATVALTGAGLLAVGGLAARRRRAA